MQLPDALPSPLDESLDVVAVELLTTAELCELVDVHRVTVSRWVASGRLTPVRKLPGRQGAYIFDRAAVDVAIASGAIKVRRA